MDASTLKGLGSSIVEEEVEVVDNKCGVHLERRLDWRCTTETIYKMGQSKLYYLRKLKSFSAFKDVAYLL